MTRFDPCLIITRMVVTKAGQRAYDEHFHAGVNVIRGAPGEGNSVGKSTIADLIFYGLGGDLTSWKDEAALCDLVTIEVSANGTPVTLRRQISRTGLQPMSIYFGDFETSQRSGADGWQVFPYTRLGDRESFTQVLFRVLEMPEVPAEAAANITMNQLLRLMYVDQMTPVDRIFRFDSRDSPLRRQAVGDLLCGVFDDRIYPAQLRLREAESEYEQATQQYNVLHRVLTNAGEGFNLDFVAARRRSVQSEIETLVAKITELKSRRFEDAAPAESQSTVRSLRVDLDALNKEILNASEKASALTYEIEDSALLLDEIERTLDRLRQGEVASSSIGPLSFMFCPSCFQPLTEVAEETCKLCRAHLDPADEKPRTARMRNELEMQLKESRELQEQRVKEATSLRTRLARLEGMRAALSHEYVRISQTYVTEADAEIDQHTSRVGYLERELVELAREEDLAAQLNDLSARRAALNEEITALKANIAAWRNDKDSRQATAYSLIKAQTAYLLSEDLHTEAEFTANSDVYFNFGEDRVTVNGKSGFSASSLTVLRNAFHFALLWASCLNRSFKYPRFLLMDNIEDKGMTEARSQNFQRLIVNVSSQITVEHQIIFTTSMIDPSIDRPEFTVGDKYDFNNKALKIGRGQAVESALS